MIVGSSSDAADSELQSEAEFAITDACAVSTGIVVVALGMGVALALEPCPATVIMTGPCIVCNGASATGGSKTPVAKTEQFCHAGLIPVNQVGKAR